MKNFLNVLFLTIFLTGCANTSAPKYTYMGEIDTIYIEPMGKIELTGSGILGGTLFGAVGSLVESTIRSNIEREKSFVDVTNHIHITAGEKIKYPSQGISSTVAFVEKTTNEIEFNDWFNPDLDKILPANIDNRNALIVRYGIREIHFETGILTDTLSVSTGVKVINASNGEVVGRSYDFDHWDAKKPFDDMTEEQKQSFVQESVNRLIGKGARKALSQVKP